MQKKKIKKIFIPKFGKIQIRRQTAKSNLLPKIKKTNQSINK